MTVECQNRRQPLGGDLVYRLVASFVKIVVYSIGVFSDYERWSVTLATADPPETVSQAQDPSTSA